MPGRSFNAGDYRFGFQGQEKDDEWTGVTGSHLNFKYRIHDARIGRFLSIDPLTAKYPFYSPYAFSGNRVINSIDLEGLEDVVSIYADFETNQPNLKISYEYDLKTDLNLEDKRMMSVIMGREPDGEGILFAHGTFNQYGTSFEGSYHFQPDVTITADRIQKKPSGNGWNRFVSGAWALGSTSNIGEGENWVQGYNLGVKGKLSLGFNTYELQFGFYSTQENNAGLFLKADFKIEGDVSYNFGKKSWGSNILPSVSKLTDLFDIKGFMSTTPYRSVPSSGVKNSTYVEGKGTLGPLGGKYDSTGKLTLEFGKPSFKFGGGLVNKTQLFSIQTDVYNIGGE